MRIFAINPGSTTTKIAVYDDETPVFVENVSHSSEDLSKFTQIFEQKDYRKNVLLDALKSHGIELDSLDAVVARGGLIAPMPSGAFNINDKMIEDCKNGVGGKHASNLAAPIAKEIGEQLGIPSYIVDSPVVDELFHLARYTGLPSIKRRSGFHTLNTKAMGKTYARSIGKRYEDLNLLICHMGGGITVSAHVKGLVLDATSGISGEGPITPERAGALPADDVVKMCFSGEYTEEEIHKMMVGRGGLVAYFGINNVKELRERADSGDKEVSEVLDAFAYNIAKHLCSMTAVMHGHVDQIILTGGIAHDKTLCAQISEYCDWIAPITVYPGEDEMLALTQGALRVLSGEETAKEYLG